MGVPLSVQAPAFSLLVPCLLPVCSLPRDCPSPALPLALPEHTLLWGSVPGQGLQKKVEVLHGD